MKTIIALVSLLVIGRMDNAPEVEVGTKTPLTEAKIQEFKQIAYEACMEDEQSNGNASFCTCIADKATLNLRKLHLKYMEDVEKNINKIIPDSKDTLTCAKSSVLI